MKIVDLRSDTVTRPTAAMLDAMHRAPLGDDVFGDDPTVNRLQQRIAELLGMEAALFFPTGTQSNLCALMSHCERGEEYLVGQNAHTYRMEGGGAAVLGGIQPQPLEHAADGTLPLEAIEANIKPDDAHFARTRLLALENTLGGRVMPLHYLQEATTLARSRGLSTHLDGARLFNAAVASGGDAKSSARAIAQCFDSVSVCFSKGLGTPAGSALVGPRALIQRAHRWRKMTGGGMRQAGVLAAAALHALDHHVDRLAIDHVHAKHLAEGLRNLPGISVQRPDTNIVFVQVQAVRDGETAAQRTQALVQHLKSRGVLVTGLIGLRMVTHLDVDEAGIDHAINAAREFLSPA